MNEYEILLMLDVDLPEERPDEILTRMRELIEREGGTWDGHEPWGRRKLAYEIDRRSDGFYHLLEFEAEPATLDEISRVLKITDGVLRHMAVRRSQTRPARPLAAVAPSVQDEEHTEPTESTAEEGACWRTSTGSCSSGT